MEQNYCGFFRVIPQEGMQRWVAGNVVGMLCESGRRRRAMTIVPHNIKAIPVLSRALKKEK